MMNRRSLYLFLFILLAFISCQEEGPQSSQFIVISNAGSPVNGIVSTYSYPSKKLEEEVYRFTAGSFSATITDAILSGNELYVIKRDGSPESDKIEVINTSNWTNSRSADLHLVPAFTRIAIHQDKMFVAGSEFSGAMHLLVFNKETLEKTDSIFLRDYVEIRKMIAHDNKIFISYNFIDSSPKLLVLSSVNYEELEEFDLPYNCEDLVVDAEGNILAFHIKGLIKINSLTLEATPIPVSEGKVFYGPGGSSIGYDRKNNSIYYFSFAAQPAPAPFHLSGYNISTGLPIEIPQEFLDASSINYNNSLGMLVMGGYHTPTNQGIVRLCDKEGNVLSNFPVPNTPLEILFK
ncbi:MAG TPA: DUF5074 domain-containing protein [Cyclobacteriaceae bacterium]|nr:DUF5074 domain-containing protein [Cyclobacteriaceae bacterium]